MIRVDVGLGLQQDAQRALQAHRFLRGGARALAAHLQRHDQAREQDHVAHRNDDERIGREGGRTGRIDGGRFSGHDVRSGFSRS